MDHYPQTTVRLEVSDGRWEVCGRDRFPAVLPESLRASADDWGPTSASFTLRRQAGDLSPDLRAYTPCEVEVDGVLVWWGEVWSPSEREGPDEISVEGRGAQYELDDDPVNLYWAHSHMAGWDAVLEHPDTDDTLYHKDFQVEAKRRSTMLAFAKGFDEEALGGIYLDLGEPGVRAFTVDYKGGGQGGVHFRAMGASQVGVDAASGSAELLTVEAAPVKNDGATTLSAAITSTTATAISVTSKTSFPIPLSGITGEGARFKIRIDDEIMRVVGETTGFTVERGIDGTEPATHSNGAAVTQVGRVEATFIFDGRWRYLHLLMEKTNTTAVGKDAWVKVFAVSAYREPEFVAAGLSVLRSEDVISDARDWGTTLSASDDRIAATTLELQHFAPDADRTPRELMQAANAYHGRRLAVDSERRVVFEQRPEVASLEVGAFSGDALEDLALSEGEGLYSDVLVLATDREGLSLRVRVTDLDLAEAPLAPAQSINPYFTTNAAGWTATGGTPPTRIVLPTGSWCYVSGVAPMAMASFATGGIVGALVPGREYVFEAEMMVQAPGHLRLRAGPVGADTFTERQSWWREGEFPLTADHDNSRLLRHYFTAPSTMTGFRLAFESVPAAGAMTLLFRDALIKERGFVLPSQRGRRRTKVLEVSATMTEDEARAVGEAYLREHIRTRMVGSLQAASGSVRRVLGGASVAAHELLLAPGERLRHADRVDPDTGEWGREGRIAAVEYDHERLSAQVSLEDQPQEPEALLTRMGVAFE